MSEDHFIFLGSAVCFILILACFKYWRVFAITNLALFLLYTFPLYHAFYFKSAGGSGFVWAFYLGFLTLLQLLLLELPCLFWHLKKENILRRSRIESLNL